ncbi:hypothetical protein LTR04_005461 [Oleoguttula sp. CCFEE 6159]|nr:hypothetical protein LTR04_005461 [Oleoguttula sp. CCFEE 6159]
MDTNRPPEALSRRLAQTFATKSYTSLELHDLREVFRTRAERESGLRFWSEATLCRFLELPEVLGVGPVIYQMVTYLGAFPTSGSTAPAILTLEAVLIAVTLLTGRWRKVLKARGWERLVYESLAVHDRRASQDKAKDEQGTTEGADSMLGGSEDGRQVIEDTLHEDLNPLEDTNGDDLTLAAMKALGAVSVPHHESTTGIHRSIIPTDNLLKLIELLLLIAPLENQESLADYAAQLTDERVSELHDTAHHVLAAFGAERNLGITYHIFITVISSDLPYLLDALSPLFEHFVFANHTSPSSAAPAQSKTSPTQAATRPVRAILPSSSPSSSPSSILTPRTLSHLSFFLKPHSTPLFSRLRPLYSGATHGFSMLSFETRVFKWEGPTILLVSGTSLPTHPSTSRERAFADSVPPSRLKSRPRDAAASSGSQGREVLFGAYVSIPWAATHKSCFGDADTTLFQLALAHAVFRASRLAHDYAYFSRPPTSPAGLGFGSPPPGAGAKGRGMALGPVSLHLDDALEFGVFTHLGEGGGSFRPNPSTGATAGHEDWQERFEVDGLEVWGVGGEEEAEAQRRAWAFEEREAERRRNINIGKGDVEADRELLRMAGLIGQGQSGGSMA